ncbi:MAG TPA: TlpA disulfide reductase family protein [Gemmataceae bacterium]|jgi:peroxiredoxin|nr:TlpA disulfide reductase family protein [Gemmataceae bacterium]
MRRSLPAAAIVVLSLAGCGSPPAGPAVGQVAPDFTGKTLDGAPFHLAELRGQVIVLDFWATWCPPCRAMIPHEREMVRRLAGKPFALVSVSADSDEAALRDFVRDERMNWTHLLDGPDGPIIRSYDVEYFPSVYVLDANGVIRYRDVRDKELERAVEKLLAEVGR